MKKDLDELMQKNGIDAFITMGGPAKSKDSYYITGPLKLTGGYVIKKKGHEPVLLHGAMERDEASKGPVKCVSMADLDSTNIFRAAPTAFEGNINFMRKIFDYFEIKGTVAFYGEGPVSYYYQLLKRIHENFDDITIKEELKNSLLSQARVTKDDDEINRIKAIGVKAQKIVTSTRDFLSTHGSLDGLVVKDDGSPLTIGEAKAFIETLVQQEKIVVEVDTIFAQGHDSGIPHSHGTDADPIRVGKTIVFDFFPMERGGGYFYDITRTLCPGEVPEDVQKTYDEVREIHDKVLDSLELGKSMKDFDVMTCDHFEALGHGTLRKDMKTNNGYVHSLGHGVGLNLHERPRVSQLSKEPDEELQPGYVFTVEPGLYYPEKEIGVRLEDIVAVWEDGKIENLTTISKDILVPLKS